MKSILRQILVGLTVIALTACGSSGGNGTKVEENGLTKDINNLVPEDTLEKIIGLGMPIHRGDNPPKIEGIYNVSPLILTASNIPSDPIGNRFKDLHINFYEQNNENLTIKINYQTNGNSSGNGIGSFIVGTGNQFTIFSEIDDVTNGQENVSVQIYSGTITEQGIEDYYEAIFMVDDKGDKNNVIISNGQGRVAYDSDGISEPVHSISFRSLKKINKPMKFQYTNISNSRLKN